MTQKTIIHVEFHSGPLKGQHLYFGSITAIFDKINRQQLGTSRQMLYRFNIDTGKPYTNKVCTIRKGIIHRKAGNRTQPVKILRVQG